MKSSPSKLQKRRLLGWPVETVVLEASCMMGGSPQSLVISALPWIWFNRMTNLIQVTGSSTGDNSNEENIRSQSFIQMKSDKRKLTRGRWGRRHSGSLLRVCVCVCVWVWLISAHHVECHDAWPCYHWQKATATKNLLVCKQHSASMAAGCKKETLLKCLEGKWKQSVLIYDSCDKKGQRRRRFMSWWGIVGLVLQIETDGARGVQIRVF